MAGEVQQKITSGCCNWKSLLKFAFFIIWTAIGIAFIVVGAIHLNNCAMNRYIPIYMIVAGAFSFAYWIILPLKCFLPTLWKILGLIISLFIFAWFIAGSVWVFRDYNRFQNGGNCNRQMYLFVFSILIIQYILLGISLIAMVFSCLCCENSMLSKLCSCFGSSECSESCGSSCSPCMADCNCLQNCNCLQCCKSIQCSRCLDCCKCSKCCRCFDCCLTKA